MGPFLVASLFSSPVWAACDADGDGYSEFSLTCLPPYGDCDDARRAINPDVAEVMSDLLDNDCDGLEDQIRRPFFVGFWGPVAHPEWSYLGGTSGHEDFVTVPWAAHCGSTDRSRGSRESPTSGSW